MTNTFDKYSNYKDSGVEWLGEVPTEWTLKPIRAIFQERNEKNNGPKTDFILSVTKDRGVIPYDEKGAIGNNKSEDIERYKLVYPNDLVINKMNVVIGSLGLSKYHGALSPVYIVLNPRSSRFNINYYSHLVSNPPFYKSLIKYCTGIMELRESLNKDEFKKLAFPVPPLATQTAIAHFLDQKTTQIDTAIAQKEKLIALLKERKQIIIQEAVTRGLDPEVKMKDSGVEWIGKIPEGWEVKKLGYLAKIGNGSTPSRSSIKYWTGGSIPWLNSSQVNQGIITHCDQFITEVAFRECHLPLLKKGDLVMAITGEGKTRGMVAICDLVTTINQHLASIILTSPIINEYFLLLYLRSIYSNIRNDSSGNGSTKGAITCASIKNFKIPLPPQKDQIAIIQHVETQSSKIDKSIALQQTQIEKLKEYKSVLIDAAVTGKIKVS